MPNTAMPNDPIENPNTDRTTIYSISTANNELRNVAYNGLAVHRSTTFVHPGLRAWSTKIRYNH